MIHLEQVVDRSTGFLSHFYVSYHDEDGKKQIVKFKVPDSEKYEWQEVPDDYPTDSSKISAHGKKLKKVSLKKYRKLSKFRVYELLNGLGEETKKKIFSPNQPRKTFFDIETESHGSFPDVNNPQHKVITNVFVTDQNVEIFGLKEMTQENIVSIERRIEEHFKHLENQNLLLGKYKVKYHKYDSEVELISAMFTYINKNVDILLGWNSLKFDTLYLANRSETAKGVNLYGLGDKKPKYETYRRTSPTGNVFHLRLVDKFAKDSKIHVPVPYHVPVLDYMDIMEQFDYPKRSKYSLDSVSDTILKGIKKISYAGSLQSLYDTDFEKFCLYNAIDSILVQLIDRATGIFDIVPTLSSVAEVPMHDALFAGMMCERMFQKEYEAEGKLFVEREQTEEFQKYEGGYVMHPLKGMANYISIYDFTSMFPTGMMAFNFGIDTLIGETTDYKTYRGKNGEVNDIDLQKHVMSPNGYVYSKDKDSSLRKMIFKLFNGRVLKKKSAKRVAAEIKQLQTCGGLVDFDTEFSKLEKKTYSSQEIESVVIELKKKEKTFVNESNAMKIIMNSIYGVLGYRYFPLYNVPVASSVTAQSRDLIQYTIEETNKYFREEWANEKEIHQILGFENVKNVNRDVIYYADTDSVMVNMSHVLDASGFDWRGDWEATRDKILEIDQKFMVNFYKKKMRQYCEKWGAFTERPDGEESFELGIEEIDYKTLFVKKKRYIKNPIWVEGVFYKPNEKMEYKGVEMKKPSYPPFVREKLDKIAHNIMGQEGEFSLRELATEVKLVRDEFMIAPVENISVIERVNNFTDNLVSENPLIFASGAPKNHRAALIHNKFIKEDESRKKYPLILNGEKIGVYSTKGEDKTTDVFGFPNMTGVPTGAPEVDRIKQFDITILKPINNIIKVIDPSFKLNFNLNITTTGLW